MRRFLEHQLDDAVLWMLVGPVESATSAARRAVGLGAEADVWPV